MASGWIVRITCTAPGACATGCRAVEWCFETRGDSAACGCFDHWNRSSSTDGRAWGMTRSTSRVRRFGGRWVHRGGPSRLPCWTRRRSPALETSMPTKRCIVRVFIPAARLANWRQGSGRISPPRSDGSCGLRSSAVGRRCGITAMGVDAAASSSLDIRSMAAAGSLACDVEPCFDASRSPSEPRSSAHAVNIAGDGQ